MGNGSGDYVIAFSTHPGVRRRCGAARLTTTELGNDEMTGLFQGVAEATEEAIYNSLLHGDDRDREGRDGRGTAGRGGRPDPGRARAP